MYDLQLDPSDSSDVDYTNDTVTWQGWMIYIYIYLNIYNRCIMAFNFFI